MRFARSSALIVFLAIPYFTLTHAETPNICPEDNSVSMLACYPTDGIGSLSVLFPQSRDDLLKIISLAKSEPDRTARLDFLVETTRRIDRILQNINLESTIRANMIQSDRSLKNLIHAYAKKVRNSRSFSGTTFDASERFARLAIQERPLSCEIAATSSILSSILAKNISENDLVPLLPKSFFGIGQDVSWFWGNPEMGFVWNIYGSQRKITWYGVYEAPITSIYTSYGLSAKTLNSILEGDRENPNKILSAALRAVESGKAVQLWGDWCTDPTTEDGIVSDVNEEEANDLGLSGRNTCPSWDKERKIEWWTIGKNLEKIPVTGVNGEHAFILLGYIGNINTPTHVIVWDVNTGKHIYPTAEWLRKWKKLGYRNLVIEKKL